MDTIIRLIFEVLQFIVGMVIGLVWGRRAERRHFESLRRREAEHAGVLFTDAKRYYGKVDMSRGGKMVVAETVVASDYLKSFLARLRNIFGGEVRSFELMMQRARREALMKLAEQAAAEGYNALCNVRIQFADVGGGTQGRAVPFAPILAYATAYRIQPEADHGQTPAA